MFWENAKVFGISFAAILVVLGLLKIYTLLMNGPLWFLGLALALAGVTVIVRLVLDVIFA